ncbi:MAG: hypothetical protein ACXAD7_12545 [Candidatus Kariarchaeaceae archaeon]|jgi:hypothetical protein
MPYDIRNYKEEYLEKHVEIGTAIYKKWTGQVQSSIEQLKQSYSGENFDPTTKFYAFKGDEMVGFLTASIQPKEDDQTLTARMEFPVVLEGHEVAANQLLRNAYDSLKSKGVKSVLSRASKKWGETMKFASELNYEKANTISKISVFNPQDIALNTDTSDVEQFDLERDLESTVKTFTKVFNISDETQIDNIRNQLKTLEEQVHKIHAQCIIREGDQMVARQLMYSPKSNPESVLLGQVIAIGEGMKEYTQKVIAKNIALAKEKGFSNLSFSISGALLEDEEELSDLGFKFEEDLIMYKKHL